MRASPRTDDRWRDALARPSKQGDWKYVAEEMAALCEELEFEISAKERSAEEISAILKENRDQEAELAELDEEVYRLRVRAKDAVATLTNAISRGGGPAWVCAQNLLAPDIKLAIAKLEKPV